MKVVALAMSMGLLFLAVGAVLAQGDGGRGWMGDGNMGRHHFDMHGDDWEEHMRGMHGEDWKEHVKACHSNINSGENDG